MDDSDPFAKSDPEAAIPDDPFAEEPAFSESSGSSAAASAPPAASRPPPASAPGKSGCGACADWVRSVDGKRAARYLRLFNWLNAVGLISIAVVAFIAGLPKLIALDPSAFLAIVVIALACLLLVFECGIKRLHKRLQANFGFLYSGTGRAYFLLFVGIMTLALGLPGVIAAVFTFINTVFNCFVVRTHPELKDKDPSKTYSDGEAVMRGYAMRGAASAVTSGAAAHVVSAAAASSAGGGSGGGSGPAADEGWGSADDGFGGEYRPPTAAGGDDNPFDVDIGGSSAAVGGDDHNPFDNGDYDGGFAA
eukprot:PLAT8629.2.p1 GENE.PLAT8629.2~~PLAT8629.2.p1  ORF type:complete len:307 (+),score=136.81 PLAT8629.2:64-984(+)